MASSRRTFDFGVAGDYRANARERYLYAHIQVMEFQPRYGDKALALRLMIFIGDGNEKIVQRLAKQDLHDFDGDGQAILATYQEIRKSLKKLPFATCHQRTSKRDWLFRGHFPACITDVLTWANWLQEFGVDRERFAQVVEKESALV